jgi:hypothetical protein
MHRFATVLREIARGGLAGLIAGIVVGGVGGRVVMSIVAVLNPDASGLLTENGEVVGRFTVQGTLALITFGGLSAAALGAVVWVIVSPWVPGSGARRALLMMPIAVAIGSFILIESTNSDFLILRPTVIILALLVALVALNGAAIAWLDDALERRLPRPGARPIRTAVAYGIVALLGVPMFLLVLLAFFSPGFSSAARPPFLGIAVLVAGLATAATWVIRLRRDGAPIPPFVTWAGRLGLVAAVALGGLHLFLELSRLMRFA